MIRWIYTAGLFIFSLFYLPSFLMKGKLSKGAGERFGHIPDDAMERLRDREVVWLHAVSVGEVQVAVAFGRQLKTTHPSAKLLFTTTTLAGREVASKLKAADDELLFFPIDWPWVVSAFIRKTNPSKALLFETEIWPNLIHSLHKNAIPVYILNGRISDKAFKKYWMMRHFLKATLQKLSGLGVQDEIMRERYLSLGCREEQVRVTGNLKFNSSASPAKKDVLWDLVRDLAGENLILWVAGSTHDGEEKLLAEAFQKLKIHHPNLRLLIAPRHLNRLSAIQNELRQLGLGVRAVKTTDRSWDGRASDVLILDEMGVLSELYRYADLVFLGGSLVPVGGHNPVEPAVYGKPIFYGPWMNNFASMSSEFLANEASVQLKRSTDLEKVADALLKDEKKRALLGKNAMELVRQHRGATQKNLDLVFSKMPAKEGALS